MFFIAIRRSGLETRKTVQKGVVVALSVGVFEHDAFSMLISIAACWVTIKIMYRYLTACRHP